MIKKKKSFLSFSSDFESVIAQHLTGKVLSLDFDPKAIYFECKFWISRSAITHVQERPIEPQMVGSRENEVIDPPCQRVNAAYNIYKKRF